MSAVPVMFGKIKLTPILWDGHCFYCRKTRTGEKVQDGNATYYALDGIALPDKVVDYSLYVEVVGIGAHVGEPVTKMTAERLHRPKRIWGADLVKVGDIFLCPNEHPLIRDSELGDDGFYIEESVPLAVVQFGPKGD